MKQIELAIIGSGPAGYTAGIYAGRAKLKPSLYTGKNIGGQLMNTTVMENFPGLEKGIEGPQLMQKMQQQFLQFDVNLIMETVTAVDFTQRPFKLWIDLPSSVSRETFNEADSVQYQSLSQKIKQTEPHVAAQAVIICTGAEAMKLNIDNEQKLLGKGVSICAVCDAAFFEDKKVFIVGGGDSAMVDALALAKFTPDVTIVHRRDKLRASQTMQDRVFDNKNIEIMYDSTVKAIKGEEKLEELQIETQGEIKNYQADGLFLAIGHKPATKIFADQLRVDEKGYLITAQSPSKLGLKLAQQNLDESGLVPFPTMTSVSGVFGAGDVVDLRYAQAITAAGMGAAAALDAELWLAQQGEA